MIPPYWEAPELVAGAQKMREQAEQKARFERCRQGEQKAR
jgi:hypothetical protein